MSQNDESVEDPQLSFFERHVKNESAVQFVKGQTPVGAFVMNALTVSIGTVIGSIVERALEDKISTNNRNAVQLCTTFLVLWFLQTLWWLIFMHGAGNIAEKQIGKDKHFFPGIGKFYRTGKPSRKQEDMYYKKYDVHFNAPSEPTKSKLLF